MSADPEELDGERGLEPRYFVKKLNDAAHKHDDCWYFVLDPQHDPLARVALMAYAGLARHAGHAQLAEDLEHKLSEIVTDEQERQQALEHIEARLREMGS